MNNGKKINTKCRNKGNNKPNRNRGNKKERYNTEKDIMDTRRSDVVNDSSYYTSGDGNDTLMSQLNSFSFTEFGGVPLDLGTVNGNPVSYEVGNIMQICINPAACFSSNKPLADGANLAGLRTYTYLSANNAKTTQYGPQDVTTLILAVGNILSQFSHGARALGMVYTYNQRNRAYPELAVNACGFRPNDIIPRLAEYKTRYNYLVTKFNKITLPKNIKYFEKCSEIFHGIYLDESDSGMAQTYVLTPYSDWIFDEAYSPSGSGLKTSQPLGRARIANHMYVDLSYSDFLDELENQIDALLQSTTFNYIYSDILRVHEKQNMELLRLVELPDDYVVLPSKVEELSIWINNLTIMGEPRVTGTAESANATVENDVVPDASQNCIIYRPEFLKSVDWTGFTPVLNFKNDVPTFEDKLYATRLCSTCATTASTTAVGKFYTTDVALCDWYVVKINIATAYSSTGGSGASDSLVASGVMTSTAGLELFSNFTKFDWHPYVYGIDAAGTSLEAMLGDLQYYTTMPHHLLKSINDVAFMNLVSLR